MFNRDKRWSGEETLLVTRPNLFLSNKGIFLALILLGVIFYAYTATIQFVANLSVNTINFVKWPITEYTAIAFLVMGIFIILYIIYKIIAWKSYKYTITSTRIITESGIVWKKKSSMPYNTIQDVVINQGILGRIIGIGSVLLYSAYDGTDLELKQIMDPHNVEEIIFEQLQENKFNSQPITPQHNQNPEFNPYAQPQQEYNQYQQPNPAYPYNQGPQQQVNPQYQRQQQNQYPQNQQVNPQYQEPYTNPDTNTETYINDYGFSTNLHTLDEENITNPGDIKYQHEQNYPTHPIEEKEFDNSIKQAMRNLDGDVKFRDPRNNLEPHNLFEELNPKKYDEKVPHDLFDEEQHNPEPHNFYENQPRNEYQEQYRPQGQNFHNPHEEYIEDTPYLNNQEDYQEEVIGKSESKKEDHRNLEGSDIMERHSQKFRKKSNKE